MSPQAGWGKVGSCRAVTELPTSKNTAVNRNAVTWYNNPPFLDLLTVAQTPRAAGIGGQNTNGNGFPEGTKSEILKASDLATHGSLISAVINEGNRPYLRVSRGSQLAWGFNQVAEISLWLVCG